MEWIRRDLSENQQRNDGKHSLGSGLGVGPKCVSTGLGSDPIPDDWCDSGLDSLISTEFISIDSPDPVQITAEPSDPPELWGSVRCSVTLDGTETERLDSAIGDSINDETVKSLSERIGTVILSEPTGTTTHPPGTEVQDWGRDEIHNMLRFISEDGDTALHLALIHEQWQFFHRLLELITHNPNWKSYLDIQNDLGQTALHIAVIVCRSECVCALLRAGASVELQERGGNTALHLAVCELQVECVKELTRARCTSPQHLNIYNYAGVSALHVAVQKGRCDIIRMLLEAGADANQMDQCAGRSPLHWAVEYQSCSAVELLLRCGASVDQRSYSGHTPLYCALYRPDTRLRELLRSAGASDPSDEEEEDEDKEEEEEERESDEEEFDDVIINGQRVL
ncbi:NF-kappa-B inhibitor beta [Tachysurus vachellii]|uniref:NF-kappa-B inhibitor beta n=1 Tax=Tachysurus vachellii TaxID=175792 RepID=UPI00296AE21B|nr:NF-kappa-B inhibitor beta [Tachysurus vachellii]